MRNKFLLWITIIITIGFWLFLSWCQQSSSTDSTQDEQLLLEKTMTISKTYIALRYQTDHLLNEAETYTYDERNQKMTTTIQAWTSLENDAKELEKQADDFSQPALSFRLFPTASAYDRNEISNIFDKAPAGKKIATLAKHLWVDAKMAFKILKNDQAQVEADAWNEAGDTFQKLETSATVIKDGCKVAGFIGGIAVTWWVGVIAAGSTLGKAAVIVWGADLILEVTDDGAKIALGNHNKISSIVGDVRKVTEPIASVLSISDIPNNLKTGFEKFTATMVALESFRGAAQEGKILGVELPAYEKPEQFANIKKYKAPVYISKLSQEDLNPWLLEKLGTTIENEQRKDQEAIKEFTDNLDKYITITVKQPTEETTQEPKETSEKITDDNFVGTREGNFTRKSSSSSPQETILRSIDFLENGLVGGNSFLKEANDVDDGFEKDFEPTWKKNGNIVRIYNAEYGNDNNYYEFLLENDELIFVKIAGPDETGERAEVLADSDFFWGRFFKWSLKKVK